MREKRDSHSERSAEIITVAELQLLRNKSLVAFDHLLWVRASVQINSAWYPLIEQPDPSRVLSLVPRIHRGKVRQDHALFELTFCGGETDKRYTFKWLLDRDESFENNNIGQREKPLCVADIFEQKSRPGNVWDVGLIPGLGRSPGEGNHYALWYSCLKNSMARGAMGSQRVRYNWATNTQTRSGAKREKKFQVC